MLFAELYRREGNDVIGALAGLTYQRQVAFVQRAHGGDEGNGFSPDFERIDRFAQVFQPVDRLHLGSHSPKSDPTGDTGGERLSQA